MPLPWDLTVECAKGVSKLAHIGASCHIPVGDELQLLRNKRVALDRTSNFFSSFYHTDYMLALLFNRVAYLRVLRIARKSGTDQSSLVTCQVPPRQITAPWPFSTDNTVLGTKYDDVVRVSTIDQWEQALASAIFADEDCALVGAPAKSPRLVIGFFWTPWMKNCRTIVNAVKDLASTFPMVDFLHVEGDKIERLPGRAWPLKDVNTFPEFVIFRNGKQLASTKDSPRKVEAVTVLLQQHINATDRVIARAQRRREEEAEDAAFVSDLDEAEEMDWIWSEECMGDRMAFDDCGTTIKLTILVEDSSGGAAEETVVWEIQMRNGEWESFDDNTTQQLETWAHGPMKTPCYLNCSAATGNVQVRERPYFRGNILCGLNMYNSRIYRQVQLRRIGKPFVGPALPEHCQTKGDEDSEAEQQQRRQLLEKMTRRAKVLKAQGNDLEAVRGGLCMQPLSGVHRWKLIFRHRPGRRGSGDAVGVCTSALENFGPCGQRKVGGGARPHSVGLFADGCLYWHDRVIARAIMPEPEKSAPANKLSAEGDAPEGAARAFSDSKDDPSQMPITSGLGPKLAVPGNSQFGSFPASKPSGAAFFGDAATQPDSRATSARVPVAGSSEMEPTKASNDDTDVDKTKQPAAEEEEDLAPLLFKVESEVAVVFDADARGGTLTFSVDGTPVKFLWDRDAVALYQLEVDCSVPFSEVDQVFTRLGAQAENGLYPVVQLCPLDGFYEKLAQEQVCSHNAMFCIRRCCLYSAIDCHFTSAQCVMTGGFRARGDGETQRRARRGRR